jgi:hypothetical protein
MHTTTESGDTGNLAQGDVRLLQTSTARDLLGSAIPARLAYISTDGHPRIVPTWFHWNGEQIVMATWVSGPHVQHPARRLAALATHPDVMISIDTDEQPPAVLQLRGRADVEIVDGIVAEYRIAAAHYLGADAAAGYLGPLDDLEVSMARISVRPDWVGLLDFQTRLPGPLGGQVGG